jgi:uncharacterized protein (DUF983 family)
MYFLFSIILKSCQKTLQPTKKYGVIYHFDIQLLRVLIQYRDKCHKAEWHQKVNFVVHLPQSTMNKGSRLYSIINNKCPKCHEGDFFITGNAYDLKHFTKMHNQCPVCSESFEPEPGYYFGAMYVSYAINVAIMVSVWVATEVLFKDGVGVWWLVLLSIIIGLALTPITFRVARLMWINMFVKYSPSAALEKQGDQMATPISR